MSKKKKFLTTIIVLSFLALSGFVYFKRDSFAKYMQPKEDECIPYDVLVSKDTNNYNVTWNTKSKCSGFVKYGEFSDNLNYTGINEKLNLSSTQHKVTLEKKWDNLYFIIISNNKPYGLGTSPMILN
ncbi:MAG TPA: hypothetical protein VHA74_03735 [Candidatus Dojkabacteria bacterium]|nr:hypothetical protein [Candidatus Dojkabacteria bacterium]